MKRTGKGAGRLEELRTFLESGVSALVGTRDSALTPEITRAWGVRVGRDGRSVSLCVVESSGQKTVENLQANGQIAAAFCLSNNYRAVQLKGRCAEITEPGEEDWRAIERHRDSFIRSTESIGVPRELGEELWLREVKDSAAMIKIRFIAEEIFDQTPGPEAGSPL